MGNNHIPPQAYTREDVAKAYVWIQSQPDYVKNIATSRDALVALYLQARRNGAASLENLATLSSKNFQTELESLANELNQFEKPKEALKAAIPLKKIQQETQPTIEPTPQQEAASHAHYGERSVEFKISEKISERRPFEAMTLDPKSQVIVDSVKTRLNMESDTEVIRMLLTLGYDKLKTIFPET